MLFLIFFRLISCDFYTSLPQVYFICDFMKNCRISKEFCSVETVIIIELEKIRVSLIECPSNKRNPAISDSPDTRLPGSSPVQTQACSRGLGGGLAAQKPWSSLILRVRLSVLENRA